MLITDKALNHRWFISFNTKAVESAAALRAGIPRNGRGGSPSCSGRDILGSTSSIGSNIKGALCNGRLDCAVRRTPRLAGAGLCLKRVLLFARPHAPTPSARSGSSMKYPSIQTGLAYQGPRFEPEFALPKVRDASLRHVRTTARSSDLPETPRDRVVSTFQWLSSISQVEDGAGRRDRTDILSLEGCCTTIVLYPRDARMGGRRRLARATAGGGSRTRTYEGVRQRIYSPPPLPLGTFPQRPLADLVLQAHLPGRRRRLRSWAMSLRPATRRRRVRDGPPKSEGAL